MLRPCHGWACCGRGIPATYGFLARNSVLVVSGGLDGSSHVLAIQLCLHTFVTRRESRMDVHTGSLETYEPPMLVKVGGFADLTRAGGGANIDFSESAPLP
ncbi:MAG: lasso RiPP family leader peptide-containing protein [Egibacteraceae bacterium]